MDFLGGAKMKCKRCGKELLPTNAWWMIVQNSGEGAKKKLTVCADCLDAIFEEKEIEKE